MHTLRHIVILLAAGIACAGAQPSAPEKPRPLALSSQELPDQMPQVLKKPNPAYPEVLKRAGIQGEAFLQMTINESGKVDSATVVRTSHEAFGLAAKEVAMKWEFIPAMKNGKPIRTVVMVPFKFALSGDDEFFGLITFATDILQKKKVAQKAETMIDPEAYAIVGHKYVLLRSVLFDRNPQATLVEGEKTEVLFSSLKSDEAKSSVVLTLKTGTSKTKGIRFHTIVFMKSSDGTWKIKSWHASE